MKRELLQLKTLLYLDCCPGHDTWPDEKYASRRSEKARSKSKQKEHQVARSIAKRNLRKSIDSTDID